MAKLYVGTAVNESFFAPLGELAVSFATLESVLATRVWHLLAMTTQDNYRIGQIVTAELSFARKLGLFRALYLHRFGESNAKQLNALCAMLESVEARRNSLTHSMWSDTGIPDIALRVKITAKRKGHNVQRERIHLKDIRALNQSIGELVAELIMFLTIPAPEDNEK